MPTKITVLLATLNGARFLEVQLNSLAGQTVVPDQIIIGDDGSSDGTQDIVARFARENPSIEVVQMQGPRQGPAANFLNLIRNIPPCANVVLFCDQDDYWHPLKIERAVHHLSAVSGPALYGGRNLVTDAKLRALRLGFWRDRLGFASALAQVFAYGHTMAMNRPAIELAQHAAQRIGAISVHDWWLFQIISGAGGFVMNDPVPFVLYRQHAGNFIGANLGARGLARRFSLVASGEYRRWIDLNEASLDANRDLLTSANRALFEQFQELRNCGIVTRVARSNSAGLQQVGAIPRALFGAAILAGSA